MAGRDRVFVSKLTDVFSRHFGGREQVMARLRASVAVPSKPVILMGGDQLTGKSTLGKNLARLSNGGAFVSVGELFREAAARRGVSVAALARSLRQQVDGDAAGGGEQLADPSRLDAELDLRTCELVGGASVDAPVIIIEGRQPAFMGHYMQAVAGKTDCVSVYLQCSPRERALRYLKREVSLETAALADQALPAEGAEEEEGTPVDYTALMRTVPGIPERVLAEFAENARRDADDRARYRSLYAIDYGDLSFYDTVVDTSHASAEQNMDKTVRQLLAVPHLPAVFRDAFLQKQKKN